MSAAGTNPRKTVLYASVGPDITLYDMDIANGSLSRQSTVAAPANVQYIWPHVSRRFLYAASSDSASGMGQPGTNHHITAFQIDPASGALKAHGAPVSLPARPIHMATDIPSRHVLVAFNNPPAVRVYRINADGSAGAEVGQPNPINPGIFPHQVLATPDGRQVILVARGFDAGKDEPEQPGALHLFDFSNGVLSNQTSAAPNGGYGFGPRHLDFYPTRPWVYVSLERQNQVALFTLIDGSLSADALFRQDTLIPDGPSGSHQLVGTVHVHPSGRFVYVANRASDDVDEGGRQVFAGGQNSIAVFAVDQTTGKPTLIQHADSHGIHPRTFHIDPSGRMMVVAHIMGMPMRGGISVPTRLTTFSIGDDGRLEFVRTYDVDTSGRLMWWSGMVTI